MKQVIRRIGSPLALTLALAAGACSTRDNKADTLAADTALNRDLQMANRDTAAQPQLNDVPAATTPSTTPSRTSSTPSSSRSSTSGSSRSSTSTTRSTTPTTTKTSSGNTVTRNTGGSAGSAGGGSVGTIAAGTAMSLAAGSKVCTNTNHVGDTFTARVNETVTGSNGATIPAGSTVTLRVTQLKRSENANDNIVIGLDVVSVNVGGRTYALAGDVTSAQVEKVRSSTKSNDAKKVLGGAAAGAVLGQVLGKNTKSTVIGAAAGAAAGTAAAAATANYEGCINAGDTIRIKLNEGVQVRA